MAATTARRTADDTRTRVDGTVRWFSHKGFGFIDGDDGTAVYVHHSAIVGRGFRTLPTAARVSFLVVPTRRGPEAEDVRVVADD